jgi:predicted TIM-barrel enzyme/AraC-like DNA-binding protein
LDRDYIIRYLRAQVNINGHIIGAAAGSGMTAKYAVMGGADLLLALSAGKYRVMGRSSYASYFCYGSSNNMAMELGTKELLTTLPDTPILFGLFATDPGIELYEYLKTIKASGFSGIVNFPTVALVDGVFREALEEDGNAYSREVEAVRLAHHLDMFTVAFVTTESEAADMLRAGADVICVHLGLTKGGLLGAKKNITLYEAKSMTERIFKMCERDYPDVFRMIYSGPANTPTDMHYIFQHTPCQGYIGGSTFDRIPAEKAIPKAVRTFKSFGTPSAEDSDPMTRLLEGKLNARDYTALVKQHIEDNYMNEIQLADIALVAQISPGYLSARFKHDTGVSFTSYLISYRMDKAKELLQTPAGTCREVAEAVGYYDYAQFSKIFKKYVGVSPADFRRSASPAETEQNPVLN